VANYLPSGGKCLPSKRIICHPVANNPRKWQIICNPVANAFPAKGIICHPVANNLRM
jgi:hypothetical protein